jgi:phospholipid-binding lipoprotein MlaA
VRSRPARVALVCGAVLLASGCATLNDARGGPGAKLDPWENWNRKVFAFNEGLDEHLLKPAATVYANVVPQPVRHGVDNFFGNMADAWSAVNNFLQGKGTAGVYDIMRVGTNTVFGLLGVLDVATEVGLEKTREDFGQTLGRWGMGTGAYIVWPLLGPSSVRDSIGLPMDLAASPAYLFNDGSARYGLSILQLINTRANLLGATRVLDDIALDKYSFVRDAYLQRRRSLVLDGNDPPPENPDQPDAPASAPEAK